MNLGMAYGRVHTALIFCQIMDERMTNSRKFPLIFSKVFVFLVFFFNVDNAQVINQRRINKLITSIRSGSEQQRSRRGRLLAGLSFAPRRHCFCSPFYRTAGGKGLRVTAIIVKTILFTYFTF